MSTLVEQIKAYAVEHYNQDGWDVLVECWEDSDILEFIEGMKEKENVTDFEGVIRELGEIMKIGRERMEDSWADGGLCTKCASPEHEKKDCPNE
jgi:hypothetical protein